MALKVLDGEGLTEVQIIAEAYAHVAEGYRRALQVVGLPDVERGDLEECWLNACVVANRGGAA